MKRSALVATALVALRFFVATLHGQAHDRLGVDLSAWQQAFVWSVIVVAPVVAAALYWTPYAHAGALLLGWSMLAGMLFGIYHHFLAVSADHVGHLPAGDAQGLFIGTALLLVPCELAATVFGFWSAERLKTRAV